jgi:nucleoside-diphosphate-sugar epimerase
MSRKTIVVAGALGLVGRALIDHCETDSDLAIVGLGRRAPDFTSRARFISVDLLDQKDCERHLSDLKEATHVVYAAWQPRPTRTEEVAPNISMLRNLMEVLGRAAPDIRHVTLLQGAKAYGSHLGPFPTPAREDDPRHMPPNFYYDQEDYLAGLQQRSRWSWTILRPAAVYGFALGSPMNLTTIIGVFAAITKHLGLPLRFPGTKLAYEALLQATDAGLLAQAILWSGETLRAQNQVYNVTNGDVFRWSRMWPYIAERFGLAVAEPQYIPLVGTMSDKEDVWREIVHDHGLITIPYPDLVDWSFGEFVFNREYDHLLDVTKLRDHGFGGYDDSFRMFNRQISMLRKRRVVPF